MSSERYSDETTSASPVHKAADPVSTWTTTNLAEAVPGVLTPLGWSIWGDACERALRDTFHAMGALSAAEAKIPTRDEDRAISIFFGRAAARAEFLCEVGDRLPGTDGSAVAEQIFNAIPPGYVPRPTRRWYPRVAARLPLAMATAPRVVRRARADTERWWREELAAMPSRNLEEAREALLRAAARFDRNMMLQATAVLTVIQPVYDRLTSLVDGADETLVAGHGNHEEAHMVEDLWACSRDDLSITDFISRHGYHGVRDGEVSGITWREDRAPLETIVAGYRDLADSADPATTAATRAAERERGERELISSLPPWRRPTAHLTLRLAKRFIPLRGVGKVAFLQSLDVARAAARRIGALLVEDETIEDPEDVFFLTLAEIERGDWSAMAATVAERRQQQLTYEGLDIPTVWQGEPPTTPVASPEAGFAQTTDDEHRSLVLSGVAASAGIVEGPVRVVHDPGDALMEPGEILVAHVTDPSWASVIYLASALVIDVGGLLSHASVISREFGVPCIAGVGDATTRLRTGDWCRVDGTAGTIEVRQRQATTPPNPSD